MEIGKGELEAGSEVEIRLLEDIGNALPAKSHKGYDSGFRDALESMVLALRGVDAERVREAVTEALDAFANNAPDANGRATELQTDAADRGLWKTTIVVWSEESAGNPSYREASDLVRDGESGESFISEQRSELIRDPSQWPDTDFFGEHSSEDDDESDDDGDDALPAPGM